jgi:peptidoglycan/LPS O-acetylase OafA/YrhL
MLFAVFRGKAYMPPLWKFLTFTQNYGLRPGTVFSHAWSLCIEEQFYLVLPLVAVLIARFRRSVALYWLMIVALVLGGMVWRWMMWHQATHNGMTDGNKYYEYIYYATWCRADELLLGIAIAMLRNFHQDAWQAVMRHGQLLMVAGLISAFVVLKWFQRDDEMLWVTVLGYPALALSFGLLTLAALSPQSWLNGARIPGTAVLAAWSYAIYLMHKQTWIALVPILRSRGWSGDEPMVVAGLIGLAIVLGWLLFTLVETPFLRLREQYSVNHRKSAQASLASLAP